MGTEPSDSIRNATWYVTSYSPGGLVADKNLLLCQPFVLDLASMCEGIPTAGQITIKLGFAPTSANNLMEFDEIYSELMKRSRPSLVSAPPVRVSSFIFGNDV